MVSIVFLIIAIGLAIYAAVNYKKLSISMKVCLVALIIAALVLSLLIGIIVKIVVLLLVIVIIIAGIYEIMKRRKQPIQPTKTKEK